MIEKTPDEKIKETLKKNNIKSYRLFSIKVCSFFNFFHKVVSILSSEK